MSVMLFDVDLANCIGLDGAIVVSQIQYWMERTENIYDDRKWVYNTIESWSEQFSFWSKDKVFRILKKLENDKILITGNYNKAKYDRTKWYSVDEDVVESLINSHKDKLSVSNSTNCLHGGENVAESLENTHFCKIQKCISAKSKNANLENTEMDIWKLSTTIPLDYTENTTEEYKHNNRLLMDNFCQNKNYVVQNKEIDYSVFRNMVYKSCEETDNSEYKEEVFNLMMYFFESYYNHTGENHPHIKQVNLDEYIEKLMDYKSYGCLNDKSNFPIEPFEEISDIYRIVDAFFHRETKSKRFSVFVDSDAFYYSCCHANNFDEETGLYF